MKKYVLKITDDFDNNTFTNCTDNEKSIDTKIPTLLLVIPYGLSFSCLMSSMIYKSFKPFSF